VSAPERRLPASPPFATSGGSGRVPPRSRDVDAALDSISRRIGSLRFRRSPWGADESDVMAKIHGLDAMYRSLLREQGDRYQALLEDRDRQLRLLQRRLDRN